MQTIPRRTFLRGTATALALPLLDAMLPATACAGQAARPPRRAAFLFVPNGVVQDAWKPLAEGANYTLSPSLDALRDLQDDVAVLTGLSQIPYDERGSVGHARPTAALLTGAAASRQGVQAGKSIDQHIADAVGQETGIPSLQLSLRNTLLSGQCDSGYSCAYSSCISWRDVKRPLPNDNNPRSVFKRLFGKDPDQNDGGPQDGPAGLRRSILDHVREDAQRLQNRLGTADRHKLDEYLYSVRQIERRVQAAPAGDDQIPALHLPDRDPTDFGERVQLLGDLMVLGFQTDRTRVCTLMFGSAAGDQTYPMIGVRDGHHYLSHHGGSEAYLAALRKIDRFNVSLFAYILRRMKSVREHDGTLLDNSIVFYGSGLGDGNAHTPFDLPVLVAGKGGGRLNTGRHLRYPLDTPLNNLWVTVAQAMGLPMKGFGNSTGPLPELLA